MGDHLANIPDQLPDFALLDILEESGLLTPEYREIGCRVVCRSGLSGATVAQFDVRRSGVSTAQTSSHGR
jgi:hypothetical protein